MKQGTKTVLVVAAHPDDEMLGCGATMARHAAEGDLVHILIIAEGATSRRGDHSDDDLSALRQAGRAAAAAVGALQPQFLGLPDNRLDTMPLLDVIQPIEAVIDELKPSIVYTHYQGDLNIDHRIVHQAVITACRPLPGHPVLAIYAFEVVSATEWGTANSRAFAPNRFVEVEAHLSRKIDALRCYDLEMRDFPHPRSVEAVRALAALRGASSGVHAAEAYEVVRERELQ